MKNILITGGAGFIGSHFCRYIIENYNDENIICLDALTYAGNLDNIKDLQNKPNFIFFKRNIVEINSLVEIFDNFKINSIINFAAESHNDRSILDPTTSAQTNFNGVLNLLELARKYKVEKFHQVSTDEVYGTTDDAFFEEQILLPNQPYSSSKAGGELLLRAWTETYNLHTTVTRGSNTYGSFQYPEKLIPLTITNAIDNLEIPVYGKGNQVREWMHVLDHCRGIDFVYRNGNKGEVYNLGSGYTTENINIVQSILQYLNKPMSLIKYVNDRPGHDKRYFMNCDKIKNLGFELACEFKSHLHNTIQWYLDNENWWRKLKNDQNHYVKFVNEWYANGRK